MTATDSRQGYASINGLDMYYEIHGEADPERPPVVLLHGAYSNIESDFEELLPALAQTRQVIAVEQQGHGRTADIDRPLGYEQMADDTAGLLRQLGVGVADLFGYSLGGGVALRVAQRHPTVARKVILAGGTGYSWEGFYPEVTAGLKGMAAAAMAEVLAGTPWGQAYARLAPNPADFPTLVEKKMALDQGWQGWSAEEIAAVAAPALLIIGDADIVRPEHTVELFRLLGGGMPGDLVGVPKTQLAVLPGTTHVTLIERVEWLRSMTEAFLEVPLAEAR